MLKNLNTTIQKGQTIYKRKWANFDKENFKLDFCNTDWNELLALEKEDATGSFDVFYEKIEFLINKYVPKIKLTRKQLKLKHKPWVTKAILSSIKVRNKILNNCKRAKTTDLKTVLFNRYKVY